MSKIFTIGRQLGSNGYEIGQALAKELGIPFYNEELIQLSAEKKGMSAEVFKKFDERPASSLLYSLSLGVMPNEYVNSNVSSSINDTVFSSQAEIIRELAEKGPCVIVGRCADYILKDRKDVINVFVYADMEERINNVIERDGVTRKEAVSCIKKSDKTRASYHNSYSENKWGSPDTYDVMVNSKIGVDKIVKFLAMIAR